MFVHLGEDTLLSGKVEVLEFGNHLGNTALILPIDWPCSVVDAFGK